MSAEQLPFFDIPVGDHSAPEEIPAPSVDLTDRAHYLIAAIKRIEAAYSSQGHRKAIDTYAQVPTSTSPAKVISRARERGQTHMETAKELFARGAGYTALKSPGGGYPEDVQYDLDLDFVTFKHHYGGPDKEANRNEFRKRHKGQDLAA